ncbi:hypothetical protein TrVE_jg10805 [Triparma verrucosa]|uniref:Fe2OG dioxygenase domain-containing protein n=1 Tax=Triparma verrucosa TaxID=1606542 RepID=A0A9W7BJT8_9STRA|nr:hypothetical protein TrVE_jg10805 [Triparma verrucosa]
MSVPLLLLLLLQSSQPLSSFVPRITSTSPTFQISPRHTLFGLSAATSPSSSSLSSSLPDLDLNLAIMKDLETNDYAIVDDFLSPTQIDAVIEDIASLRSDNRFSVAGIGQDKSNTVNSEIRKTETMFIYPKLQFPTNALSFLYPALDRMALTLGSRFQVKMDLALTEALYAYYPNGGFYKKHIDAVPSSASVLREFSFLIYLNKEWSKSDGGCLRLYTNDENHLDVEPTAGKLVIFKSDTLPHEVLETSAERLAVVGWFNREVTPGDISALGGGDLITKLPLLLASAVLIGVGVSML